MAQLRIDEITEAKSGKTWRVKIGSQWYGASKEDIFQSDKGQTLDITTGTTDYGPWIKDVKRTAPGAPTQAQRTVSVPQVAMPNQMAPYWQTFVSNQVASAIQAGLIKEPTQLKEWTFAAMNAIKGAVEGDIEF